MSQMNPKKNSTILQSQFNHHTLPVTPFKNKFTRRIYIVGGMSLINKNELGWVCVRLDDSKNVNEV